MLSQTVEYALRAMVHLASLGHGPAASSASIAERTRVPKGYLSKILRDLVVAGLVTSRRGPNGGFVLARGPGRISMLDVVDAVDPIRRVRQCPLGNPAHLRLCPLHQRIDDAMDLIAEQFRATTLAQVIASNAHPASSRCRALAAPAGERKKP